MFLGNEDPLVAGGGNILDNELLRAGQDSGLWNFLNQGLNTYLAYRTVRDVRSAPQPAPAPSAPQVVTVQAMPKWVIPAALIGAAGLAIILATRPKGRRR